MKITVPIYTYVCQHCGKQLKKSRTVFLCQRCGQYLCRKHEKDSLCPRCRTTTDIWIQEGIRRRLKAKNSKFWATMILFLLPSLIFYYLLTIDTVDMTQLPLILVIPLLLMPGILLLPLIFHWVGTSARKAVVTRDVLRENKDIPFLDFFSITLGAGFIAKEIDVNPNLSSYSHDKLMYIINNYGINQLMTSFLIYFHLHGVVDDRVIQQKVMELFTRTNIDLERIVKS